MIRKLFTVLLLVAAALSTGPATLTAQAPAPAPQNQSKEQTVYVTKTGKKYHRATCRYLSRSKISTSLKDAKANRYSACSVCRPPQ